MNPVAGSWVAVEAMLRADQQPERFIAAVERRFNTVVTGERGLIPEAVITPVESLPSIDPSAAAEGEVVLDQVAVIKLNGGLATSMGLERPKSLLPVKGDQTFLDIVMARLGSLPTPVPLILFNSFATDEATKAYLHQSDGRPRREHPAGEDGQLHPPSAGMRGEISIRSIVQHRQPKLAVDSLLPIDWPHDPVKAWCPPGHGDLYLVLETSGLLAQLLDQGIEYAFVSNLDNLGATLDLALLGQMVHERVPLLMEAARRTPTDTKGGHLAFTDERQLTLREIAQCPAEDLGAFQDIERHRFFNTNSLWLHLPTVAALLKAGDALTDLPLIVNRRSVDPADPVSPPVLQLETAMGSAISAVSGARAVHVNRARFAPVKTTNELLVVRSDAYTLTDRGELQLVPERREPPIVRLGPAYKLLADFTARFPQGAPSLRECDELTVDGNVTFGANVVVRGSVHLTADGVIPDGTVLGG